MYHESRIRKNIGQMDYITMPLWLTTVITVISNKTKIDILIGKINPGTSEVKAHGKAYKHLKVNLDFFNSGEKKRKGGRCRYALNSLAELE